MLLNNTGSASCPLSQCSPKGRIECAEEPCPIPLGQRGRSTGNRTQLPQVLRYLSRPASAFPIFASVHCFPVGETMRAAFLRQRDASGISEVTHTSVVPIRAAIQSSAAPAVSPTRTILTFEIPGGRIGREPFETTRTLTLRRAATR